MKEFTIDSDSASQRFDKYLRRILPNANDSFIYKMLRKKNITLNHKKATGKEMTSAGDIVQLFFSDETFQKFSSPGKSLEPYREAYQKLSYIQIIYEDEHILLADKPSSLLTQKSADSDISLNDWLIGYLKDTGQITEQSFSVFRPSVLNRLDYNTSGIVICGKTLAGSQKISELLKNRKLRKFYVAYVEGEMTGSGTLTAYHKKDRNRNEAVISLSEPENMEDFKKIITKYRVLDCKNHITRLEIELITGKTHQIRAHLAAIHHPVAGDAKYGSKIKRKDGQLLHCYKIIFPAMDGPLSGLSGKTFICDTDESFNL